MGKYVDAKNKDFRLLCGTTQRMWGDPLNSYAGSNRPASATRCGSQFDQKIDKVNIKLLINYR